MKQKQRGKSVGISGSAEGFIPKCHEEFYSRTGAFHQNISSINLHTLTNLQYMIYERGLLRAEEGDDTLDKMESGPSSIRQAKSQNGKKTENVKEEDSIKEMISIIKEIFRLSRNFQGLLCDFFSDEFDVGKIQIDYKNPNLPFPMEGGHDVESKLFEREPASSCHKITTIKSNSA